MNARIEPMAISAELLLDVFDIPVSFHRCLVPVAGGVTPALMLSQAIWTTQTLEPTEDSWFLRSQEQWSQETGLTRWEQETARRALRQVGLLENRLVGMPAKLWFRVSPHAILRALQTRVAQRGGGNGWVWVRHCPSRWTTARCPRRATSTSWHHACRASPRWHHLCAAVGPASTGWHFTASSTRRS